jgi:hypothetical protein
METQITHASFARSDFLVRSYSQTVTGKNNLVTMVTCYGLHDRGSILGEDRVGVRPLVTTATPDLKSSQSPSNGRSS